MKTWRNNPIKMSWQRQAELVGIMIWSAHWHGGQCSQEYRMGCRARQLLRMSNEIGDFMARRWFDALESYVVHEGASAPRPYTVEFCQRAKKIYSELSRRSENQIKKINPDY